MGLKVREIKEIHNGRSGGSAGRFAIKVTQEIQFEIEEDQCEMRKDPWRHREILGNYSGSREIQ
jgi:hypothetical protein